MKTAPGSRWSDKDFAFDLELMENNYFENQSLRKLNSIILTPGSQMGRGHQSEDCPPEAMLHAAGSRSDLCHSGDAGFVVHVCGTTEEVFTSIYFLTTISLLQFTFPKIVSLSMTHVASRFFKRTSSACWEQPPESFKHGPRRAWVENWSSSVGICVKYAFVEL